MAGSSNPSTTSLAPMQDFNYLCASIANVSNFVSVKLSSKNNYNHWKTQMLCLIKSQNMVSLVDENISHPVAWSNGTRSQYDSLLKGWIFGSVSENILGDMVDLVSAKDVWLKLESSYDATSYQVTVDIPATEGKDHLKKLHRVALKGDWSEAESILQTIPKAASEKLCNDGSTILHVAVGKGHMVFLKKLISYIKVDDVLKARSSDGSTALHIAATIGNTHAAILLVKKNINLLRIPDLKGEEALHKAYENMHEDTIEYLSKVTDDWNSDHPGHDVFKIHVDILVNFISGKKYNLASKLIKKFPDLAVENEDVLMAIAKSFPRSPQYTYSYLVNIFQILWSTGLMIAGALWSIPVIMFNGLRTRSLAHFRMSLVPKRSLLFIYQLIYFLILMAYFLFLMLFSALLIPLLAPPTCEPIKERTKWKGAKKVLQLVCDQIDGTTNPATRCSYYNKVILEAACQGAYKVVEEILLRSPEAIQSRNENGHDIIQLAVLHRSVQVYNLIYEMGERKKLYSKIVDSSKNNILHLAGKLTHKTQMQNPALLLQRELQWFQQVKTIVLPSTITQENNDKETPDVFCTREHENLVKEGEKWMKSTAKSGSIIAALITSVVFSAAISVPDVTKDRGTAFKVFAIANLVSLSGSSIAILAFLSILTGSSAEYNFLRILPFKMLIGRFGLFVSTIAMMVAYSATVFLLLFDQNKRMIGSIILSVELPITYFVLQEIPIILSLYRSIYVRIFGKRKKSAYIRYHPDKLRLTLAL